MKLILLINVKMPTMVGILTFISRINETSERFEARKMFIFHQFFCSAFKISCSVELSMTNVIISWGQIDLQNFENYQYNNVVSVWMKYSGICARMQFFLTQLS